MKASETPRVQVRTLLCHRDVPLLLNCWRTLFACCEDPIEGVVHEDGSLTREDAARIEAELPGCRILWRREADERMAEVLTGHAQARAFRAGSVWGLKLLDVALAEPGDCFYVDGDIRFLRRFRGLFCREALAGRSVFIRDTVWTAYSIRPWHLLDSRKLRVVEGINTGLTLIDRASYDLDFVEWFLSQPDWRVIPAWTEPTCWAALAARAGGHAVAAEQLLNLYPAARVNGATVGVHLLSAFRDRHRGLLECEPALAGETAAMRIEPLRELGATALGWNQLKRKWTNEIARRRFRGKGGAA